MLERVVPEHMTFINAFTDNVYNLATHPYGCRVLQRCFEHVSPEQSLPLLDELHQNATALMQDQFGVSDLIMVWCLILPITDVLHYRTMSFNSSSSADQRTTVIV